MIDSFASALRKLAVLVGFLPRILRAQMLRDHASWEVRLETTAPVTLTNPSIGCVAGDLVVLARQVNYEIVGARYEIASDAGERSETWCFQRDAAGVWAGALLQVAPSDVVGTTGLEDPRTIEVDSRCGALWTTSDPLPGGGFASTMVLGSIRDGVICDLQRLDSPYGRVQEKNWMPVIEHRDELRFVYYLAPFELVARRDRDVVPVLRCLRSDPRLRGHSGSSQVIPFDGRWLCVSHRVVRIPGAKLVKRLPPAVYLHYFVELSADFEPVRVSRPFFLRHKGIEFCAGLAPEDENLLLSFGVKDREAWLMAIPTELVRELLSQ